MNKKSIVIIGIILMLVSGCATSNGFRALDKDEMEMNPVCEIRLKRFTPTAESAALEYKGRAVYFCCSDCVEKFNKYVSRYEKEEDFRSNRAAHNSGGGNSGFGGSSGGGHQH